MKPRLLDLFCGAGGAAVGYARAGFDVVGVDIVDQPTYPFEFVRGNALDLKAAGEPHFDAIHASPPCQAHTAYRRRRGAQREHPDHIGPVRELLRATGLPYVIENVVGAPLNNPVQLCGSSFGLDVRRHRLFETSWPLLVPPCNHGWQRPRFPQATNRRNKRSTVEVGSWRCIDLAPAAMGIWWMTNDELSQAIPPAYTQFIGEQLLTHLEVAA